METITWTAVLLWMTLGAGSVLPAPRLTSSPPYTIFAQGEWIFLNCSIPEGSWGERFYFDCQNESGAAIQNGYQEKNTFNLTTADLNSDQTEITCTCSYWGKPERSSSLNSKQLVFAVIAEGGNTEKRFHFYKDGVEMTTSFGCLLESSREPRGPSQNASLRILHAKSNHSGEFACSYEEKRSSQWIMSSWSQGVNVTVWTKQSDPMWRYAWLAVPSIMLWLPFAFCCWKKKSNSPSQEQFQLEEKREEGDDLGTREPQAATAAAPSPVKHSEVTYSHVQIHSFTPSPPGPTMENHCTREEEGGIVYSDIMFQPKKEWQNNPLIAAKRSF